MAGRYRCKTTKRRKNKKRNRQRGGFLSRYDFAYVWRDTVNQAFKDLYTTAAGLIKDSSNQVNKVAEQRIQQIIDQGARKIEKVAPKIIRGAIEDVYQTPIQLLGKFGKKKLAQVKQKINKGINNLKIFRVETWSQKAKKLTDSRVETFRSGFRMIYHSCDLVNEDWTRMLIQKKLGGKVSVFNMLSFLETT